ncbi:RluA family pseudouridine synthase [Patescibacteria group bacterium]|nr:RluA family pseudouridine synthase [Patescibacteria group bacterium]
MFKILYEDNHCIAIIKPHNIPVQGDQSGDKDVLTIVKEFIKTRDSKPGNVFLGLIHRLDRPVAGIVILAKTSKGASRLSEQFRAHTIIKTYTAIVEGKPKQESGEIIQWLVKDHTQNKVTVCKPDTFNAKKAELNYKLISYDEKNNQSTIKIYPKTGRPHQIRVAMSKGLGCPIVGDTKYGAKASPDKSIALCATGLEFDQPVTKEKIKLTISPNQCL